MTDPLGAERRAERQADRLLRWYPVGWRHDYGEEFAALLMADIAEQPRSWRRTADVARSGMLARLTGAGLRGEVLGEDEQARASLAVIGSSLVVFVVFAGAMWSQLTVGWQWSRPAMGATTAAMFVMSAAVLVVGAVAGFAVIPVIWCTLRDATRRQVQGVRRPALVALAGAAVVIVGSRHFANGWPGTGGHPWTQQGLVPGGVAAFTWAATLSISSYWVHPGALLSFPPAELAWMATSPLAMTCVVVGAARTIRRLELSPRLLRVETAMARVATLAMAAFAVAGAGWLVEGGPGPGNLFHAGAIDVAGLAVIIAAVLVAHRAAARARTARPPVTTS